MFKFDTAGRKKYILTAEMALNTYGLKVEPIVLKNNRLKILVDIENIFEDTLETEGLEIFVPNLPVSSPDTIVLLRQPSSTSATKTDNK